MQIALGRKPSKALQKCLPLKLDVLTLNKLKTHPPKPSNLWQPGLATPPAPVQPLRGNPTDPPNRRIMVSWSLPVVLATVFVLAHLHLTEHGVREGLHQLLHFWSVLGGKQRHYLKSKTSQRKKRWERCILPWIHWLWDTYHQTNTFSHVIIRLVPRLSAWKNSA